MAHILWLAQANSSGLDIDRIIGNVTIIKIFQSLILILIAYLLLLVSENDWVLFLKANS